MINLQLRDIKNEIQLNNCILIIEYSFQILLTEMRHLIGHKTSSAVLTIFGMCVSILKC